MKVFKHMEESWGPSYSMERMPGWIDALTEEADVPSHLFARYERAFKALAQINAEMERHFEKKRART